MVSVFPNPLNQDNLTIKLDGYNDLDNLNVLITNLQGQVVYQNRIPGKNTIEICISGLLKSSIYFVSVRSEKSIFNTKIIVQ